MKNKSMIFLEGNLALLRHFCNFAVTYEIFIYLNSAQHPKNQSCCETGLVYFVHLLQNSSFAIQFHLFFQLTFSNFANEKNELWQNKINLRYPTRRKYIEGTSPS